MFNIFKEIKEGKYFTKNEEVTKINSADLKKKQQNRISKIIFKNYKRWFI